MARVLIYLYSCMSKQESKTVNKKKLPNTGLQSESACATHIKVISMKLKDRGFAIGLACI